MQMRRAIRDFLLASPAAPMVEWVYLHFYPCKNARYDRQALKVMRRALHPDSNWVDVGAHRGSVTRSLLGFAPNGKCFAFEPIPEIFQALQKKYPQITVLPFALSDQEGEVSFQHVVSNPGYSGLKKRQYPADDFVINEITVATQRLDNIIPEDIEIDFIKIDVEGAEMGVLKGSVNTIRSGKPVIIFEHGLGGADYYGTRPDDVYDFLHDECGLELSLMVRWIKGMPQFSRQEFIDRFRTGADYYYIAYPG